MKVCTSPELDTFPQLLSLLKYHIANMKWTVLPGCVHDTFVPSPIEKGWITDQRSLKRTRIPLKKAFQYGIEYVKVGKGRVNIRSKYV